MGDNTFSLEKESLYEKLWRILVIRPVLAWQEGRCEQARRYLLTHDADYRSTYAGLEIVKRRNILYDEGVSPSDPRVPDRWTLEEEMPPMSWPHKGIL